MARFVAAAALVVSVLGPSVALGDTPIDLTSPPDGAVLVPGQSVSIAWERSEAWPEASEVPIEEWEAFLSVNGGATYPYRVTPHLDADVTSFHFPVPEVVSDDVRILVRMGNERREVGFEMPQRFSIAAAGPLLVLARASRPPRYSTRPRGEAARPGEAGVRTWVEGDRRGRNLRLETATAPPTVYGRSIADGSLRLLALLGPQHQSVGPSKASDGMRREAVPAATVSGLCSTARAASILLLIQRSNR